MKRNTNGNHIRSRAWMQMYDNWLGNRITLRGKKGFYALLRKHNVPYKTWNKKAKHLFHEIETGMSLVQVTSHSIVRTARTVWVVVLHTAPDGTEYFLYEQHRKFPNGTKQQRKRWARSPPNWYPVAISETCLLSEDALESAIRALREEAKVRTPARTRLLFLNFRSPTFHRSVAYQGLISGEHGELFIYHASAKEYGTGKDRVSVDEHGVETRLSWAVLKDISRPAKKTADL